MQDDDLVPVSQRDRLRKNWAEDPTEYQYSYYISHPVPGLIVVP